MAVENQENGVRKALVIFIVPAWGFVVAARTEAVPASSEH